MKLAPLAALALAGAFVTTAPAARAQTATRASAAAGAAARVQPSILGTWQAKQVPGQARSKPAAAKPAVQLVVIRPDSSASYGKEVVRWRLRSKNNEVMLAIGGEWVTYRLKLKGNTLTLSGGDLPEAVTLTRVGPPTARPAGMKVPADPDTEAY